MIKNFYDVKPDLVGNIHDGEGIVKVANIFETFSTKMQFLHYTILPPGTTIGAHRHGSDEEFYIILEGTGEMELDGEKFPVTAGHVIRNEPFGSHGLKNLSDQNDLRILVFEVKQ
jgi:quercetin dioxygenase-like cupin family protein